MLDLIKPFTGGFEERFASSSTPTDRSDPNHEVVEGKSLNEKLPSVVTDAERRTFWQKIPRVRKVSWVPNHEETTMCSLIIRKTPTVRLKRKHKPHEPGVG